MFVEKMSLKCFARDIFFSYNLNKFNANMI